MISDGLQSPLGKGGSAGALGLHGLSTEDYLKAEALLPLEQKAALAARIASIINAADGGTEASEQGESILRLIIWNAEPAVILAAAQAVAANPNSPRSVAWALANDDDDAAKVVLEASGALGDEDLVAIVESSGNATKMTAIARRSSVSQDVSSSLANHGDEATVNALLQNTGAQISDDAMDSILDRHGDLESVQAGMIDRAQVSESILKRLSSVLGPELAEKLASRHPGITAPATGQFPTRSDKKVVGLPDGMSDEDRDRQIAYMVTRKSITAQVLIGKIFQGHFAFVCQALAALSESSAEELFTKLQDAPAQSLADVWKAASLPPDWAPATGIALASLVHINQLYSKADTELFRRNIVDRTTANIRMEKITLGPDQRKFFRIM